MNDTEKIKISTIQDIVNNTNKENLERFLNDFTAWLKLLKEVEGKEIEIDNKQYKVLPETSYFIWIDDKKDNLYLYENGKDMGVSLSYKGVK